MRQAATLLASVALLCIGAWGVLGQRNMIKICIGLTLMESAVILMLVALSWRPDAAAPILESGLESYTDPLPQALALTAIVIGAALTALALTLTVRVHQRFGTVDLNEIREKLR